MSLFLRKIGIVKRANVMLLPPHNLRACIKFRKPETVYYYVGRIIEIRTAPNNARVTPQSFLSDPGRILYGNSRTKQIKFILCGSMRLYAGHQ